MDVKKNSVFFKHLLIFFMRFIVFIVFALGRVLLYTVFVVFPLPKPWPKPWSKIWVVYPRKIVRHIDQKLFEKHIKNLKKTAPMLLPKNPKLQINQSDTYLVVW